MKGDPTSNLLRLKALLSPFRVKSLHTFPRTAADRSRGRDGAFDDQVLSACQSSSFWAESHVFTPGARVPVTYLRSRAWSRYLSSVYERNKRTVPLFQCPVCFSHRDQTETSHWRTPTNIMSHISYAHMHDGWYPSSLEPYNRYAMKHLVARVSGLQLRDSGRQAPSLRLLVWIDVANLDLSTSGVLLDILRSPAFRPILQQVPIGWCCTHELFVPHTCTTLHAAYQLRCLNMHSDLFPFYAVTRSESGDLATSAFIAQLQSAVGREVPILLVTLDAAQRQAAEEVFGRTVVTPLSVSSNAIYHAVLQALGDGIQD